MRVPSSNPKCHPARPYYALGLCKPCWNTQQRRKTPGALEKHRLESKQYKANHGDKRALASRKHHLRKHYDIGLEDYEKMCVIQLNRCAVCFLEKPLEVDHDHDTGEVRKLLCRECNVLVGWVENHGKYIPQAIAYIKGHNGKVG